MVFRAALAFLLCTATTALACDANPVCTVTDPTGTPLNIRMGPNEKIVGTAKNGTKLTFIDHQEANGKLWARVAAFTPETEMLDYGDGYLFASYLKCESKLTGDLKYETPVKCSINDPTGTPLNIRTAPNGEIAGSISNGQIVQVYETKSVNGKLWALAYRNADDNPVGWVFDDFLKCEEDAE